MSWIRGRGWVPRYDFGLVLERLRRNEDIFSPLARLVGRAPDERRSG